LHCGADGEGQPYDVASAVCGLDAAVICVQEVWLPVATPPADGPQADLAADDQVERAGPLAEAARKLGATVYRARMCVRPGLRSLGIAADSGPGELSIAVLTTLPVTRCELISLGRAPGDHVGRIAQVLTLAVADGTAVRLVNTHLTYALSSPLQLGKLLRSLYTQPERRKLAPTAGMSPAAVAAQPPTIIAGDLNMPRFAAAGTPWLTAARATGIAPSVRGLTYPATRPVIQLDHILASRGFGRLGGAVLPPAGSDHLPVRAQLTLPERQPTSPSAHT
jgi:endonuclease/exonuclease/phosphatase family metal-dependent hydrolase